MAGAVLVGLHWLFGYLAFKLDDFGSFVKSKEPRVLELWIKDGVQMIKIIID